MSRLTCHVLDATAGRPAAGVAVTLRRLSGADATEVPAEVLVETVTDADGRALLVADGPGPGRYEVAFAVGDHFGLDPAERYLDVVPVHIGVPAGDDVHVHVALLATPWSYTTYRGS